MPLPVSAPLAPVSLCLLLDPLITPLAFKVYTFLSSLDQPSQAELADLLGVTRRGIQKAIHSLARAGWLHVVPNVGGRRNWYLLTLTEPQGAEGLARRLRMFEALRAKEPPPESPDILDDEHWQTWQELRRWMREGR